ncbi:MarR family winged helix-turn-helix transcriptional regulator [Actinomycetospora sp. TBRC 11914]|uniref:MarR family winged helix-turn-helix transcriptional regulator n=1 Tax=Actinomycetospora sp. TBRC 11914 TaxID=2729387 RepID=UPI00145D001D|nr:MarR family transcriptional regulator [Actinomycetospora sp. TBRC 11914]NMO89465.1 MarR family transcriptional regulator [Actinomycetospora sp. TBRC 11914]
MQHLAEQVRELIVASDSFRRTMAAGIDLSVVESAVLGQLLHDGRQTPTVIAARAGLTPAAATSMIDRLESAGHVRRGPHPHDRRSLLVELTDRGRAAVVAQFAMFSDDLRDALERADPRLQEDPTLRRALTDLLAGMAAALRTRAGDAAGVRSALQAAVSTMSESRTTEAG